MQLDQLVIGRKASHDDFDATLKERHISAPAKKTIKETVPFSNITYDFSAINGELYWEERDLQYILEIIASSPEEMEEKKTAFSAWVMNVMDEPIYDPYEPEWHYKATFEDIDYDDDESLEKTTITVNFKAYPYKIANTPTVYAFTIPASGKLVCTIENGASHRMTPVLVTSAAISIEMGGVTYTLAAGEYEDDAFRLKQGSNVLTITNKTTSACTFRAQFYREVF